jgi:hypothetical protein
MDKHRINISTKMVIVQNIKNWLNEECSVTSIDIALDASNTLKNATHEQITLGWENWLKCRWSQHWASLVNHDILTASLGIKHNTSENGARK